MEEPRKTKIGQRRTEPKRYTLKRKPINKVSKKRQPLVREYKKICEELKIRSGYKSELSGEKATAYNWLEVHHINGRNGKDYIDPFNLIVVLNNEHQTGEDAIHKHNTYELKQTLLQLVYQIRLEQGYNE